MDDTYNTPTQPARRSTFLTVICILSFLGGGWGILGAAYGYVTAENKAAENHQALEKMEDQMGDKEPSGFMKFAMSGLSMSADDIRRGDIVSIISSIFTLAGAVLMFTLRKNGFYIYIAGIVISIIGPLLLFGSGGLGLIGAIAGAIIGGAFVAMYGANIKYMTR
ncbi:MAG: hypothetical protein JST90_18815 [Bacteroidetes bacterium]|nr:hypothetical protein [Bacteroidota bacterium]